MNSLLYGLLLALAAPLLLIPIEKLFPAPHIIEEIVKLGIVLFILKSRILNPSFQIRWVILAGMIFTLSESILYLINIFMLGDLSLFGTRLLLTGILHVTTMVILYLSARKRVSMSLLGFILAVTIHYWYNATIVRLVTGS